MGAEATTRQTPPRPSDALTTEFPATSSPAQPSDDDTISDNSFEAGSDHFTFTPKRASRLPRAWERKPATPYAPRTETQKIWKRVPLQDKCSNGAVEIRGNGEEQDDARGVKRLRLTAPESGSGKENYANTCWDKQSDDAKRKMSQEQKSVLQSTRNSLSPLRQDCTYDILNDPPPPTALELEANNVIGRLEQMQRRDAAQKDKVNKIGGSSDTAAVKRDVLGIDGRRQDGGDLQNEDGEDRSLRTSNSRETRDRDEESSGSEGSSPEDEAATTPLANEFFTDSIIFDDHDSESEVDEEPIAEEGFSDTENSHNGSDNVSVGVAAGIEAVTDHITTHVVAQEQDWQDWQDPHSPNTAFQGTSKYHLSLPSDDKEATVLRETKAEISGETALVSPLETMEGRTPIIDGYETMPDLMDAADGSRKQLEMMFEASPPISNETVSKSDGMVAENDNGDLETCLLSETNLNFPEVSSETAAHLQIPSAAALHDALLDDTKETDIVIFGDPNGNLAGQLFTPQAPLIRAPEAPPSDDTTFLHNFLSRIRAQKAAQTANSPEKMGPATSSPAKNTRQALANLSTNPTSPSKVAQTELKPDHPTEDEMNEDQATSPCRRSSRPRLPKPQKSVVPAIPNTIPVRRSNGTEFVFLQRTEAMQVALATRTNTKRNKGEALPPSVRLESLASGEISPIKERKKALKAKKAVKWDEKLTQEQIDAVIEDQARVVEAAPRTKPETQTKVEETEKLVTEAEKSEKQERKKAKRLGTVNGTPAPKKVMAATALPVPTRTLRARTKA